MNSYGYLLNLMKNIQRILVFQVYESNTTDDTLLSGISDESVDIVKYGDFYIGRYEAGIPEGDTTPSNKTCVPVSKRGITAWTNIEYANIKVSVESIISTDYVQSGLLTEKAWDTTCHWIEDYIITLYENSSLTNSIYYGNYYNSEFIYTNSSGSTGKKDLNSIIKIPAGCAKHTKIKNIYNLAENVWEWTSEVYVSNCIDRGGSCGDFADVYLVSYRNSYIATKGHYNLGFCPRLYIK